MIFPVFSLVWSDESGGESVCLDGRFRSVRNLYVLRYLYLESRESAFSRAAFCGSVSSFMGSGFSFRT